LRRFELACEAAAIILVVVYGVFWLIALGR
jgi:hypothetical protein